MTLDDLVRSRLEDRVRDSLRDQGAAVNDRLVESLMIYHMGSLADLLIELLEKEEPSIKEDKFED